MIDLSDVMKVLGEVIIAADAFPRILWPNRAELIERPFLALELRPGIIRDQTIGMDGPVWNGDLIATAVIPVDTYETDARSDLAAVAALFPAGSRLTLASGVALLVSGHPRQLPGYRDGSDYRLQLSVPLQSD